MSEEEKIISDMLHIILKYSDDFDELEENEIRYQLPYKKMEKLYNYIFDRNRGIGIIFYNIYNNFNLV